jgi:hypothetical protein
MKQTVFLLALTVSVLASFPAGGATLSWTFMLEPSRIVMTDAEPGRLRATIDGYATMECSGYPALPYRTVRVLLPQDEELSSYRFESIDESPVTLAAPLSRFGGLRRDDGTQGGAPVTLVETEPDDGAFPPWRARYLGTGFFRGYRLATFALYPVRYDERRRVLVVSQRFRLVLETEPIASSSVDVALRWRRVEGFRKRSRALVEAMVVNPEAAAVYSFDERTMEAGAGAFLPSYEPSMEGSDVTYLIVTNEEMAPAFQRLADSKTAKGVPAVVRTVEWIVAHSRAGADLAESVRLFIRDAYARWGVEWVVLGGDTDVIPARYGYVMFPSGILVPTDLYYSCLDGSWNADGDSLWGEAYHSAFDPGDDADLYAEVYLGRLPASTRAEAELLVDKTIGYETPADTASKRKFLMMAQIIFPSPYNPGDPIALDGAEITEDVYSRYLSGNPDAVTARLYQNDAAWPGSLPLTKSRAIDSLDAGTNHVLYAGHGSYYNMSVGTETILNYDADHLSNGNAVFSLYIMSCSNAAFDTECLAEAYLLSETGGAFAVTGSSRPSFPSSSRPYLDEYYRLLFDENVVQLGALYTRSREPYTPYASAETADRLTHFIYNYLGDPEICMFQGAVKTFAVTKPGSAMCGRNDILIHVASGGVPYDSAFVCLYKEGEDYEHAATDASGNVLFHNFLCTSAGSITVTVTGRNHCRYAGTIPVTQAAPPYLTMAGRHFDDTVVGNNDGVLDAGETVNLSLKLRNTGQSTAAKLYAIVRSSDPAVTVTDSTALYPTIVPGAEAWGNDPVRFSVDASVADQRAVEFTIDVRDSTGGFWSERVAFDVHAPALERTVAVAADTLPYGNNNGIIEAGESFRLKIGIKNFGSGVAHGLHAKIRSLDPDIVVSDSLCNYADLGTLGTSFGDGFVLSEANLGDVNYFRFELSDAYGRMLIARMELRRPAAPSGIVLNSTYGPHEIHVTWHRPDSLEAYRYQVYHSLVSGGPYDRATDDLVSYTLFRDAGLLGSTKYYFTVTAVDSCGNEGPRSAEATATTNPPMLAGWPQKVGKETSAGVKIGDIDGDTHPEIVAGSDYLYVWHADGIEVRDGDGQPLTWGVFNTYGGSYTIATVALAELDGVRGLEIVAASWSTREIYIFKKDGSILAGWPKSTASYIWASPVVGDIDGDQVPEIVAYDVGGVVYAWHANGTEVRDGDNNPATNGPFFVTKNPGTWHLSTPALADMDNDGVAELIVCSPNDSIYCLNGNGSRVPGWPISVIDAGTNITASPAVGDIDGDGRPEVIIQNSAGRVFALNHDGSWMPGWPQWVSSNTTTTAPSPALADLNGDGKLEIVLAGLDSKCYVFRYNGTQFPGWPQPYTTSTINRTTESSPIVADVDGDGNLDIILGCEDGTLHAWKSNGVYVPGFPIQIHAYLRGTPVVYDFDLDGRLEIATSCWDKNIYIWDLTGAWYRDCAPWNGFHANIHNTGWKEEEPPTGWERIVSSYRFTGGGIELSWMVVPGVASWDLYRRTGDGDFELLAFSLAPGASSIITYADMAVEEGVVYRYRLEADAHPELSSTTEDIVLPVTAVRLYQNHPNPFNPVTTIPFAVQGDARTREHAMLAVYDVRGSLVKTLIDEPVAGGRHEITWDGRNELGERVASGIYFVHLRSRSMSASAKIVLLR